MSMNPLRSWMFELISTDTDLNALGLTSVNLYANYSPDSPTEQRWMVLRWGPTVPGIGPANGVDLSLWAYDREPDYAAITDWLAAARRLLDRFDPVRIVPGVAAMTIRWTGSTSDLYDDAWAAYTRSDNYRLTAAGA